MHFPKNQQSMLQLIKNDLEDTLQPALQNPSIEHYQTHRIVGDNYLHRINTKQPTSHYYTPLNNNDTRPLNSFEH